jgi:hypothetical protein
VGGGGAAAAAARSGCCYTKSPRGEALIASGVGLLFEKMI